MSNSSAMISIFATTAMAMWLNIAASSANGEERQSICVTPFSNNTGDAQYDVLADALSDMLAVELSESKSAVVIERQKLRKVLDEHKITLIGLADPATAVRVGKLLKADRILVGGLTQSAGMIHLSVQVYEIDSARLVRGITVESEAGSDIASLIQKATKELEKVLNIRLPAVHPNEVEKNPQASYHLSRGLGFYFSGNYDAAAMELMKVQDLDPTFEKAGYWIALCFLKAGEKDHARIELQTLIRRFPQSSVRSDAEELLKKCEENATKPALSEAG